MLAFFTLSIYLDTNQKQNWNWEDWEYCVLGIFVTCARAKLFLFFFTAHQQNANKILIEFCIRCKKKSVILHFSSVTSLQNFADIIIFENYNYCPVVARLRNVYCIQIIYRYKCNEYEQLHVNYRFALLKCNQS